MPLSAYSLCYSDGCALEGGSRTGFIRGRWLRLRSTGLRTYVVLVFAWMSEGPRAIVTMWVVVVEVQCVGGGVDVPVRKLRAVLLCQAFSY